ncbi:MAG: DUF934 domain-containing protein [Gammaproteobacteria bacterium]
MRVIKDNSIVEDNWQRIDQIDDDQSLPDGDVIVPFSYWQANREELLNRISGLGICINGDVETEEVARDLNHFSLIALEFPKFNDGRSYSHARLLRDRYGFKGELRAVGDVLRDQLFFMKRCGIDSFELRKDKDIEDALNAFSEFSVKYQPAADATEPVWRHR